MMAWIVIAITALLWVSPAGATTWHVAKTGSDSNTCAQAQSASTPKLTINNALANCSGRTSTGGAGHTIIVHAGTYDEDFQWDFGRTLPGGTSWAAPFTLQAATGESVTIAPTTGACGGLPCLLATFYARGYIIVDGLKFDATNQSVASTIEFQCDTDGDLGATNCAHHVRLINGEIDNSPGSCIYSWSGVTDNELVNMRIHRCGTRDATYGNNSLYLQGSNWLVDGIECYDGETGCIMFWDAHGLAASGNVARNNLVHDMVVKDGNAVGIGLYNGTNYQAYNNVIYNIAGQGIVARYVTCSGFSIMNNTIFNTTTDFDSEAYGIDIGTACDAAVVKNNIAWDTLLSGIRDSGSGNTLSNNICASGCNISSDPLFTNEVTHDLTIQSGSPAKDAGTNTGCPSTDKLGVSRPQNSTCDIGAYEVVVQRRFILRPR